MDPPEFDELVIALLTAIAKERLQFVIPIIRHQPSGWIIDGNHRLEVIRRLKETDPGLVIGHRFQDDYSPDPETLAIELNKARRPWDNVNERRTQVQILAKTPVPGGRSGKGGGANGKPPAGTIAPPSNKQIAAVLGVDESTVREDLKNTAGFPAVPQTPAPAADLKAPAPPTSTPGRRNETRNALRRLCKEHGAPSGIGSGQSVTVGRCREWLREQRIPIPPELDDKSTLIPPSSTPVNGNLETATAEPEADITAGADHITNIDLDAIRQRINAEVQRSDRPADFKRAIELLTELDAICTAAWYRKHPEPWGHDDWAHVASEIALLHSIVGQRAEETADELIGKMSAIRVEATTVA